MSALDTGGIMFEHFRKRNEKQKQKQLTAHGQEASQRAVFYFITSYQCHTFIYSLFSIPDLFYMIQIGSIQTLFLCYH